MAENVWREENCTNIEPLYCEDCNIIDPCPAAWHCDDIVMISDEILAYYDSNSDGSINMEGEMEFDHWTALEWNCDLNADCTVDACELHECVMMVENEWRDIHCPDYGYVYCSCPYNAPSCP
jgi:hypothetical protein